MQRSWAYYSIVTHLTPSVLLFLASSSRLWSRSCACIDKAACIKQCQEFKVGLTVKKTRTMSEGPQCLIACMLHLLLFTLIFSSGINKNMEFVLHLWRNQNYHSQHTCLFWTHLSGHLLQHRVGRNCPANAQKWQVNVPARTLVPIANGVIARFLLLEPFEARGQYNGRYCSSRVPHYWDIFEFKHANTWNKPFKHDLDLWIVFPSHRRMH